MRRVRKARAMTFERTRRFFRKVKENLFPDGPFIGPQAEVAGMAGVTLPVPCSEEKPRNHMEFNTGGAPVEGTPSRKIMDWGYVDILDPNEQPAYPRDYYITREQAREEISELLKSISSSHQYIVSEAVRLCAAYPEAVRYKLHMMVGALGEDFVFGPQETIRDVFVEPPRRERGISDDLGGTRDIPSLASGLFKMFADLYERTHDTPDDDPVNRPYCAHFYDPERKEGDRGLNILNGDIRFQSALDRIIKYWVYASECYEEGDKPRAFYSLGHAIHLVADLYVPAHVHNDIHGPTVFLGKLDSLEEWCGRADYPHPARGNGPNIRIWNSNQLDSPPPNQNWNKDNIKQELARFADAIAKYTQNFRSVDAEGTHETQKKKGRLSDDECYYQASYLIPGAMHYTAQMIVNFLDYHRRGGR